MSPSILNIKQPESMGYYSLSFPSVMFGSHLVKGLPSFMPDLKLIKLIVDYLTESSGQFDCLYKVSMHYFHVSPDKFKDVEMSTAIPTLNHDFKSEQEKFPKRAFCATSAFWRGCIGIMPHGDTLR